MRQTLEADASGLADLFRGTEERDDYYILSMRSNRDPRGDFDINFNAFSEQKYILFLVHTDDVTVDSQVARAQCLILRQVADRTEDVFERVGSAVIWEPSLEWLGSWESQVLTLV